MRAVIPGLFVLAGTLAGSLGVLHAADPLPVTIAVLRGDGVLIPIATRTGRKWAQTWPVPLKSADVPLQLDGVPKKWWGKVGPTKTWHAWTIDGKTSEAVVDHPTWYLAHCQQGVGLQTGLTGQPPIPPPEEQPYPTLGLAATSKLAFRAVAMLDERAPLWPTIRSAVASGFAKAEDAMPRSPMGAGRLAVHPIADAERPKTPLRLESLYRVPLTDGRSLYFFEAAKRYRMPSIPAGSRARVESPGEDGCSTMVFGRGWLVVGDDEKVPIPAVDAEITSCDYGAAALMLPLGYVPDPEGTLLIAQYTSWEAETFAVLRADRTTGIPAPVILTHGGWCAREPGW